MDLGIKDLYIICVWLSVMFMIVIFFYVFNNKIFVLLIKVLIEEKFVEEILKFVCLLYFLNICGKYLF